MSSSNQNSNKKNNSSIKKLFVALFAFALAMSGLTGYSIIQDQNNSPKDSFASAVYGCSEGETLAATNCLSNKTAIESYTLGCKTGYTLMDTTCSKFETKACTSFAKGMNAEDGWCKFEPVTIYGGEILNFDGRECNGSGYSYYRYNVGLTINDTTGPIVCGNTLSLVSGKENFRWMPKSIIEISNLETIKNATTYAPCASGYSDTGSQCSRSATIKNCSAGEVLGSFFGSIKTQAATDTTTDTTAISNVQNTTVVGNNTTLTNNATPILTDDLSNFQVWTESEISQNKSDNDKYFDAILGGTYDALIASESAQAMVTSQSILASSVNTSSNSKLTLSSPLTITPITPIIPFTGSTNPDSALSSGSTSCIPCPANSYCNVSTNTNPSCGQGSTLVGVKCQAAIRLSQTTYTDGCGDEFIKLDKTCAIKQIRTHDFGCSYYFASNNEFIMAVDAGNGQCSTGGRTDFDSTNIFRVDGPQCAGPGTGWYNYNVAYDPLVCGFTTYNPNDKAAFRWSADSYVMITGLQKIPTQTMVCPSNWTPVAGSDTLCEQNPINLTYTSATPCPSGTTSPVNSITASACKAPIIASSPSSSKATSSSSSPSSSIVSSSSPSSSSPIATVSTSSSSTTPGASTGVIVISNSTSSSSTTTPSSSSASPLGCTNAPIGTFGNIANPTCLPCAPGKTTLTEGAKNSDQCVSIATVAVSIPEASVVTTRTGGLATLSIIFMLASAITAAYIYADSHLKQGIHSGWNKGK